MSPRASDSDFDSPGRQRRRGDVLRRGSVERDNVLQAFLIRVHQRPHAAKIPFPFFAYIRNKKNGVARLDLYLTQCPRHRQQSGQAGAVVGNSGSKQPAAFPFDGHIGSRGKYRIQMSRQHDDILRRACIFADHVAGRVDFYSKARRREQFLHVRSASGFMERRRRNFSNADLLVGCRGSVRPEEFKDVSDAGIILKSRGGRLSRKILGEGSHCNPDRAQ